MSKQPITAGYMTVTCIDNSDVEEYLNIGQSYTLATYNSDHHLVWLDYMDDPFSADRFEEYSRYQRSRLHD